MSQTDDEILTEENAPGPVVPEVEATEPEAASVPEEPVAPSVPEVKATETARYSSTTKAGYALLDPVINRPELLSDGVPVTNDNITHQFMERVVLDRKMKSFVQQFVVRKYYPIDHPYFKVQ